MNMWQWSGRRGGDILKGLSISREEACAGARKTVVVTRRKRCPACRGRGIKQGFEFDTCPLCEGRGSVNETGRAVFGTRGSVTACRRCGGTGSVNLHPCGSCGGYGSLETRQEMELEIPPGARTGQFVRVAGQGGEGWRGGPPGDLLVELTVEEPAAPLLDRVFGWGLRQWKESHE